MKYLKFEHVLFMLKGNRASSSPTHGDLHTEREYCCLLNVTAIVTVPKRFSSLAKLAKNKWLKAP